MIPLLNDRVLAERFAGMDIEGKRKRADQWLDMLDRGEFKKERGAYLKFSRIVLEDILGYDQLDTKFEQDDVEFQYPETDPVLCFEVKGSLQDLDKRQDRKWKHRTPVIQTWDYIGKNNLKYGVCSNCRQFVLLAKTHGYQQRYEFDFESVRGSDDNLRKFIGVFSKESLVDGRAVDDLVLASSRADMQFTDDFYSVFYESRIMLLKEFMDAGASERDARDNAQIFLNRLIFIFFVEDRGLVGDKSILRELVDLISKNEPSEHSRMACDKIREWFDALDKGSKKFGSGFGGFNGELFEKAIPRELYFKDVRSGAKRGPEFPRVFQNLLEENKYIRAALEKRPDINPLIANIILMGAFDFSKEVNVDILGRVFEKSLADIEDSDFGRTRRKKEGAYYTPQHITDYICRHSIIPHLSESGAADVHDLVDEYEGRHEALEERLGSIRILDPACGSGAFLIKAAEILVEIDREIVQRSVKGQTRLDLDWERRKLRDVIKRNIYGVDITEQAVEIAKLSMFLKLASSAEKLPTASHTIKAGNSLAGSLAESPFVWEDEFPDVFADGGFDVIVTNPPYFNIDGDDPLRKTGYYSDMSSGPTNIASLFLKLGVDLLKPEGSMGVIIPKSFLAVKSWSRARDLVLSQRLKIVNDVGKQWPEVGLEQVVLVVKKAPGSQTSVYADFELMGKFDQAMFSERGIIQTRLNERRIAVIEKIESAPVNLARIAKAPRGITAKSGEYSPKWKAGYVQVYGGSNIGRFFLKDGGKRKPNRYLRQSDERIVSRQWPRRVVYQNVASSVPRIVAAVIDGGSPADDTVNNLTVDDPEKYPYEYIAALLNSTLMTFYLRYAVINDSALTVHLDEPYIGKIPVKDCPGGFEEVGAVADLAGELGRLKKQLRERLEQKFPRLEWSRKLDEYYRLEPGEFYREVERRCGVKKGKKPIWSTSEQSDFGEFYGPHAEKTRKIANGVQTNTERLDAAIFRLYGISKKEAAAIAKDLE